MLKGPSDEMIARAADGDEEALASVLTAFRPLIRRTAATVCGPGFDYDDAVQEGMIGLFHAVKSYDRAEGSFAAYASVCVRNAVTDAQRRALRKKQQALSTAVPLDDEVSVPGPEEITQLREQLSETLDRIDTALSPLERAVLLLSLRGCSYGEIAGKLGRKQKDIDNALTRARRKLRDGT